jgi:hypothetical protein
MVVVGELDRSSIQTTRLPLVDPVSLQSGQSSGRRGLGRKVDKPPYVFVGRRCPPRDGLDRPCRCSWWAPDGPRLKIRPFFPPR